MPSIFALFEVFPQKKILGADLETKHGRGAVIGRGRKRLAAEKKGSGWKVRIDWARARTLLN